MTSRFIGRLLAVGFVIGAFGTAACTSVPAHPTCSTDSECPSTGRCHLPNGAATGVCVETCSTASSCPSSEPQCVPEDNSSSPFSFCACQSEGPTGTVSTGCGANNGYGCSVELQVCLPR